nr:putative zinc finger, CCHC-type [Tanacetum cinerariifolium]
MSSSNHLIIASSDPDIKDVFSFTNVPDYFLATPGNTSHDSSNNLTKYLLTILVFSPLHDDPYMEVMQAYDATNELPFPLLQAPIAPLTILPPSPVLSLSPMGVTCIPIGYPMPEFIEDVMLEQTRKQCKWENGDYIYRGHILNDMSDALFDVYQNVGLEMELWDQLESKYMTEDDSSKKIRICNFNNYKMVDSRSVMEQYHELFRILRQFTQHGLNMDESILVSSIIDKLPPS